MTAPSGIWAWLGGRKMAKGLIGVGLITAMARPLGATFTEYSGAILLALGITAGSIAWEDRARVTSATPVPGAPAKN